MQIVMEEWVVSSAKEGGGMDCRARSPTTERQAVGRSLGLLRKIDCASRADRVAVQYSTVQYSTRHSCL